MVRAELAERFLSAPMLAGVEPGLRQALLGALVEERAEKGAVLLKQGQPNDHLSFLIAGSAAIERKRGGPGVETLATLTAPSVFGTTSFFRPDPPTFTVRATSDVWLLTLYHPAHDRLRANHPLAAEALAVATVRVLAERLNELDQVFSKYMAEHPDDHPKVTEWAGFRARLFEEPND
jgi:CRP/FNR family cyclic AMP-dependent transcriptional regulator